MSFLHPSQSLIADAIVVRNAQRTKSWSMLRDLKVLIFCAKKPGEDDSVIYHHEAENAHHMAPKYHFALS